jgi:peptide methionine sulfoxide reductase MsrA
MNSTNDPYWNPFFFVYHDPSTPRMQIKDEKDRYRKGGKAKKETKEDMHALS